MIENECFVLVDPHHGFSMHEISTQATAAPPNRASHSGFGQKLSLMHQAVVVMVRSDPKQAGDKPGAPCAPHLPPPHSLQFRAIQKFYLLLSPLGLGWSVLP